jgi:multicomponent Na+:H+ antiporter subunit B
MQLVLEVVLYAFLLALAIAVVRTRDLFAAAMLTGIFSLVSAGLFTLLDAVDVAFTEAAVGAGIATVLMLGTLSLTDQTEVGSRHPQLALASVIVVGAALVYGTLDMPHFGDPLAPIHHHVADRYLTESPETIGVPNVVTAVLASYRGYDTLGELVVVLTAGVGVLLLLGASPRGPSGDGE